MANGKPGDHPFTDIFFHKMDVYTERAAILVRQIARLADDTTRRELADRLYRDYDPYGSPDVERLEEELEKLLDRLVAETRDRGFELPPK